MKWEGVKTPTPIGDFNGALQMEIKYDKAIMDNKVFKFAPPLP